MAAIGEEEAEGEEMPGAEGSAPDLHPTSTRTESPSSLAAGS